MPGVRDRLVFDTEAGTVRDGPRRYLLMRPDVLMGMFGRLDPKALAAALEALAQSAEQHGGDSLAAYFASLGCDPDALLDATAAAAADLGWGRWSFHRDPHALRLVVTESPFAQGFVAARAGDFASGVGNAFRDSTPVCAPIRGLLAAAARLVLGVGAGSASDPHGSIDTRELACAAAGHACCEFVARRLAGAA